MLFPKAPQSSTWTFGLSQRLASSAQMNCRPKRRAAEVRVRTRVLIHARRIRAVGQIILLGALIQIATILVLEKNAIELLTSPEPNVPRSKPPEHTTKITSILQGFSAITTESLEIRLHACVDDVGSP